jgi:hypothetical protein
MSVGTGKRGFRFNTATTSDVLRRAMISEPVRPAGESALFAA